MEKLTYILGNELAEAFAEAGYDPAGVVVKVSDRPDLCEFQSSAAMPLAKTAHKAPLAIAEDVKAACDRMGRSFEIEAVRPGFLNMTVKPEFLADYIAQMAKDSKCGIPEAEEAKKMIVDYGGPNVAKPLHVGHLRAAVIGESIKRILRAVGHDVLGDVHLGDWGLQIGLIIAELRVRNPELPYFDENADTYPEEAPFTISELEEIYPFASAKSKTDEAFREEALKATSELQSGRKGYRALWQKIMEISTRDLKKNYERLDVHFDLWKGESDVQDYIPGLIADLEERGIAKTDQGALIVDVSEEGDKKEVPPCIIRKSDGAALYATTDIATIYERMKLYHPDKIIYVVDKRQAMHFVQVFRTVRKAGITDEGTELVHVGFGTMNGKDGKPFKTRDGGVMRLESLLNEIEEGMETKIRDNKNVREEDAKKTAEMVALSAVKYGDLSNQAAKDYVFDTEKFTSFEGNTGPYILYTIVRCKSILERAGISEEEALNYSFRTPSGEAEKALMLDLADFGPVVADAARELAPHRICAYIYRLSNSFNHFYHGTRILAEEDASQKNYYLALLALTEKVLLCGINLLGFSAPDHM